MLRIFHTQGFIIHVQVHIFGSSIFGTPTTTTTTTTTTHTTTTTIVIIITIITSAKEFAFCL